MTQTGICYIVGGGDFDIDRFYPGKEDCIIAADSGLVYIEEAGYHPQWIVGDFDSLGYRPKGDNIVCHPVEKDDTDVALAAEIALEKGYRKLYFFGISGGRLDHTLANLQLLTDLSQKGVEVYCFCPDCTIAAISAGTIHFTQDYYGTVSVFAATQEAKGVCIKGLKYALDDATLVNNKALGVSNEFTGQTSEISVKEGVLWVMWQESKECRLPEMIADCDKKQNGCD